MAKEIAQGGKACKITIFLTAPKYIHGIEVLCNYKHAIELNKTNSNTKWTAAELKMELMHSFNIFNDKKLSSPIPKSYKCLKKNLIYDVKHDSRHHTGLLADRHLTKLSLNFFTLEWFL